MFVINKSLTSKITEIECQEIESKNDQFKKMRKQRGKIKNLTPSSNEGRPIVEFQGRIFGLPLQQDPKTR